MLVSIDFWMSFTFDVKQTKTALEVCHCSPNPRLTRIDINNFLVLLDALGSELGLFLETKLQDGA